MSPRELAILLIGLCIVAVILRGLYVAMQARRGQIRLSIDKNIPQNVDLEALEMAELPSGGARVVARSLESVNSQNSKLDAAEERAQALNLSNADDEEIPVLLDTVELAPNKHYEVQQDSATNTELPEAGDEAFYQHEPVVAAPELGGGLDVEEFGEIDEITAELTDVAEEIPQENVEEASAVSGEENRVVISDQYRESDNFDDEDGDEILLDYEDEIANEDPMAAIAPDYGDEENEEEDVEEDYPQEDYSSVEHSDEESSEEESSEEEQGRSFEDQLETFSMSAGERIGYGESPKADDNYEPNQQASLFDEDTSDPLPQKVSSKSRSIFNVFRRGSGAVVKDEAVEENESEDLFSEAQQDASAEQQEYEYADSVEQTDSEEEYAAHAEAANSSPVEEDDYSTESLSEQSPIEEESGIVDSMPEYEGTPATAGDENDTVQTQPSEVLVVNVMARDGYAFAGDDLLQVLITSGLKFGEMNIFHYRIGASNKGAVLFSVANVLNPGTFDLNNMNEFSTLGVSFFLALPTAMNNLDAFEQMLKIAQQVKGGLDGELRDDNRNVMTAQTIEHYRQRVRDFELRVLRAASARP